MSRVFNYRTQKWTEERLGTVSVEDRPLRELRELAWYPTGPYYSETLKIMAQWGTVLNLIGDPTTRRAVIHVTPTSPADQPCLCLIQFVVRGEALVGFFYWRSSSKAEREQDISFMRWLMVRVASELNDENVMTATIFAFRASDHDILDLPVGGGGSRGSAPALDDPEAVEGEAGRGGMEPVQPRRQAADAAAGRTRDGDA